MANKLVEMALRKYLLNWQEKVVEDFHGNTAVRELYEYSIKIAGTTIKVTYSYKYMHTDLNEDHLHSLRVFMNQVLVCSRDHIDEFNQPFPPEFTLLKTIITMANPQSKALRLLPDSIKCIPKTEE